MSVTTGADGVLPPTCRPPGGAVVWCWPTGAVYAGPPLGLDRHSGVVACLAVAVDGTLQARTDDHAQPGPHRAVLIPARVRHHLVVDADRAVFAYLDPGSAALRSAEDATRGTEGPVRHGHDREADLVDAASRLGPDAAVARLRSFLDVAVPVEERPADDLIGDLLPLLRARPADPTLSAVAVARLAQLSTSRFLRRFRAATGTSFRRYRAWTRLLEVAAAVADGADLTSAAHEAGFASSAHLSTTFRRTFGLPPSQLLAAGATVVALDADPRRTAVS